ncbi:MAG: MBL fold metallo-hydrolase [Rhodospirillales bacterium]|nr:MBL fold metallo-hydrolase [Rhodospirillales bacterium]
MNVTLLGHASVLVEMEGATCLMDPVFFDPFEEGAVTSCPRRLVFPDRLPHADTVIISHRHPDHFDLRSLCLLPREADVILPVDPLIGYALKELGFRNIHPVEPMAPILSDRFELYPTRSETATVREFGMVFRDSSGTFWNQVDGSLSGSTIDAINQRFEGIELLFAMYASQNFDYFDRRTSEFPGETHRGNLESVIRIDPKMVVPAAGGFRFRGAHAWLNAFLFPISRQRFVEDLKRLGFRGATVIANPGDVFHIEAGGVDHRPSSSEAAVMEEDDSDRLCFDPTAPVPALSDPNPDGWSIEELRAVINPFVANGLAAYVHSGYRDGDRLIDLYRRHAVSYSLAIVLPDGGCDHHRFDFAPAAVRMLTGSAAAAPGNVIHRIAASALVAWIEHRKSFFYIRGYSRRHQAVYEIAATADGVQLRQRPLPDLLMHYLFNVAPGSELAAKDLIDRQLAALSAGEDAA